MGRRSVGRRGRGTLSTPVPPERPRAPADLAEARRPFAEAGVSTTARDDVVEAGRGWEILLTYRVSNFLRCWHPDTTTNRSGPLSTPCLPTARRAPGAAGVTDRRLYAWRDAGTVLALGGGRPAGPKTPSDDAEYMGEVSLPALRSRPIEFVPAHKRCVRLCAGTNMVPGPKRSSCSYPAVERSTGAVHAVEMTGGHHRASLEADLADVAPGRCAVRQHRARV